MKDAVFFIINSIVGNDTTQVNLEETPVGVFISLRPAKENLGKIIGKKGKIINAVRKILKVRALKEGKKFFLKIEET